MILPTPLPMILVSHVDGRRGYWQERSRDSSNLGVEAERTRASYSAAIVYEWTFDWLPNRVFATLDALRAAVWPLTDAFIAAEKARYPAVRSTHAIVSAGLANKCSVCRRQTPTDAQDGVLEIYLARNWRLRCDAYLELCNSHLDLRLNAPELARKALAS